MNPVAQILWDAAADVEQRGVTRKPDKFKGETCAIFALEQRFRRASAPRLYGALYTTFAAAIGTRGYATWNDAQPSRATVAAAMRDAAFLAEWAGDWLIGGEPQQ